MPFFVYLSEQKEIIMFHSFSEACMHFCFLLMSFSLDSDFLVSTFSAVHKKAFCWMVEGCERRVAFPPI